MERPLDMNEGHLVNGVYGRLRNVVEIESRKGIVPFSL